MREWWWRRRRRRQTTTPTMTTLIMMLVVVTTRITFYSLTKRSCSCSGCCCCCCRFLLLMCWVHFPTSRKFAMHWHVYVCIIWVFFSLLKQKWERFFLLFPARSIKRSGGLWHTEVVVAAGNFTSIFFSLSSSFLCLVVLNTIFSLSLHNIY